MSNSIAARTVLNSPSTKLGEGQTSPQYAIIASNDVAAAMMEGKGGHALTGESIAEAVDFRQMMARLRGELEAKNGRTL